MRSHSLIPLLSPYDMQMISVLKTRLKDSEDFPEEMKDNSYLHRFLFARDYNTQEAEIMLRNHLEWYKKSEICNIERWEPPEILLNDFKYDIYKKDRNGLPVVLVPLGTWDIKLACDAVGKEVFVRYVVQSFMRSYQLLVDSCNNNNNEKTKLPQFTAVITLDKIQAMKQLSCPRAWSAVMDCVRIFESNFPEVFKIAFVVDAPRVFRLLFNIVKPVLSSHTLSKVNISSHPSQWMDRLHELVSPNELPVRLGGTKKSHIPTFNDPVPI